MPTLDYESPDLRRRERRVPGRILLASGLLIGGVAALLPEIFGHISLSRGDSFHSIPGIAAAIALITLTILGICRRIEEDGDPSARIRTAAVWVAVIAITIGFCEQFGWRKRTTVDTVRLIACVGIALICCLPFLRNTEPRDGQQRPVKRWNLLPKARRDLAALLLAVAAGSGLFVWHFGSGWIARQVFLIRANRWYAKVRHYQFPPMSLQYSENPADWPTGRPAASVPGWHFVVDPGAECQPLFDHIVPRRDMLFVHERKNPQGHTAIISATLATGWIQPILHICFDAVSTDRFPTTHIQRLPFDGKTICGPGELRIFSGQPDPDDPSSFYIPFQTKTKSGRLVVRWVRPLRVAGADDRLVEEPNAAILEIRWDPPPSTHPADEIPASREDQ